MPTPPPPGRPSPPRSRPLRLHLLALVLVGLLPSLAAGGFAAYDAVRGYRVAFELALTETAAALAVALDAEMRTVEAALLALAGATALEPGGDLAAFHARRAETGQEMELGILYFGPGPEFPRLLDTRRPFGLPALADGAAEPLASVLTHAVRTARIQTISIRRDVTGAWVTGLVVPVRREGRVIGLLAGVKEAGRLSALLADRALTPGGIASLLDAEGRLVARSRDHGRFVGQEVPALARHAGARGIGVGRSLDSEMMVFATAPLSRLAGWTLVVAEPLAAYRLAVLRPLLILGLGALAALAVAAFAARLLARRLLRPIAALARDAAAATREDAPVLATPRAPPSRVREFAALRAALEAGAAQLARRRQEAEAAAAAVRAERALLRAVLDGLPDAVFVKDREGRYLVVNRPALSLLGRDETATLGQPQGVSLPQDATQRLNRRHAAVLATGQPARAEADRTLPTGERRRFETLTAAWSMPGEAAPAGTLDVSRDVTEQRRVEAQLLHAEATLADLARRAAVSALASSLAHELNQPLAAAANYLNAARRMTAGGGRAAATEEALAAAAAQILRAGEIIRRLRDFLAGHPPVTRPEPVAEVAAEAVRLARAAVPAAEALPVRLRVPEGLPPVPMDRVQIQQVLVNLLRNAVEAMADAPPGREPAVEIEARLAPGEGGAAAWLEVSVTDNGPGLPPGLAEAQVAPLRSAKAEGMGLGLAICRDIIGAHQGRMRVEPGPGGIGARITFALPLRPDEAALPAA